MLTKWLTDRPTRNAKKDHSFRPWLESLEERNAPSNGHGGGDHGNGHGHDHVNGNGGNTTIIVGPVNDPIIVQSGNVHNNIHITNSLNGNTNSVNGKPTSGPVFVTPPPPSATVSASQSSSINAQGSFNNSTFTNSFNNTMNVTVNLPPAQAGAVGGLLGISNLLSSALSNPQLGTLLNDEIALAVDNYLTSTPAIASVLGSTVVSDLKTDATMLTAAISANPLESSPIGAAVGMFVYTLTFDALTSAQPKI